MVIASPCMVIASPCMVIASPCMVIASLFLFTLFHVNLKYNNSVLIKMANNKIR